MKINSKEIKDEEIETESMKYIGENSGRIFQEIDHREVFNKMTAVRKTQIKNNKQMRLNQIENFMYRE